jgi:hypothetical protein
MSRKLLNKTEGTTRKIPQQAHCDPAPTPTSAGCYACFVNETII